MKIYYKLVTSAFIIILFSSCGAVKPQVPAHAAKKKADKKIIADVNNSQKQKRVSQIRAASQEKNTVSNRPKKKEGNNPSKDQRNISTTLALKGDVENQVASKSNTNSKKKNSYSNYIRVKTVYELAAEANPPMFFPHDEFETASEYQARVSDQVSLMKEIVQMTSQKMEIKNAQRKQVAAEKELKTKTVIESLMAESSSPIEFTPTDIGRYNAEKETFPVILHNTQYQISVPREEARTFKSNFESVKIKGIKQLKPKYDVLIKVSKAHIRSRPNGSIVGIASADDLFEHVQDEDEWYKINYKGQFGFTHVNNAELKLVDIADEYEYHDLVAIHPTTGSMFAMISVDKLVKAPLNLASRKLHESGQPDGP